MMHITKLKMSFLDSPSIDHIQLFVYVFATYTLPRCIANDALRIHLEYAYRVYIAMYSLEQYRVIL